MLKLEKKFDKGKLAFKKKLNLFDPFMIYPYMGYGNQNQAVIQGRIIEIEGILEDKQKKKDLFSKLTYMYRRFESDEIPHVKLKATMDGQEKEIMANEEGFFKVDFQFKGKLLDQTSEQQWKEVHFEVTENPFTDQKDIKAVGKIYQPHPKAEFGIISDIDDTIIKSHASTTFLKFKTLLLNTAESRVPFKGIAKFYQGLRDGNGINNPLFFVSGSTWNIYDLLVDFCEAHKIPLGPFFLKEFRLDKETFMLAETQEYKLDRIKLILNFYSNLKFVLIGDSGQKDTEIYAKVCKEFPDRILAVYIRKISESEVTSERKVLIDELRQLGIDLLMVHDTGEAAEHATKLGLIPDKVLQQVKDAVQKES